MYSHLDTIAVTDNWKTNPLQLKIVADKAYGLGAWDMKAGIVANIITFLHFQPKNYKLRLCFCVDEENISQGGYKLANSVFAKDVICVMSIEPAFQYGLQGIVIGRVGRAIYDVKFCCQAKHFAFYEKKFDINLAMAEFLTQLPTLSRNNNKNKQHVFARKIKSQAIGLSLPQETVIELDSATFPATTHHQVLQKIQKLAQEIENKYENIAIQVSLKKRLTPYLESYQINTNKYLSYLTDSVSEITKKRARSYFRSSVADDNIFANRIITLGIGPTGGNAHAPNEWVSLSSIEKLSLILNRFLAKIDNNYVV